MPEVVLIAHDIRSTHNIGALLRTAEGLGASKLYMTGYTPYPQSSNDARLPHISKKLHAQIHKTALGAEKNIAWQHHESITSLLQELKNDGFKLVALEQSDKSIALPTYQAPAKVAILLGREVEGIDTELVGQCDTIVEIPMKGKKESFNVVEAATMIMYHCTLVQKSRK